MRKILYLVTKSEWGGAQEYVCNLATSLPKDQFEVLVLAGEGNDELFQELSKSGIRYQKLKYTKRAINPFTDLKALFELKKIFKREKPDIIHLNSSKIGFLGSLAGKPFNLKIIYTAHGWVFNEPLSPVLKKIYYWIEKKSSAWKDVIICVSEADRRLALKNHFQSNIITIHNAVDWEKLDFLPPEEARGKLLQLLTPDLRTNLSSPSPSSKLITAIANLYQTKGLNYLIEAAKILTEKNPDLKFVIIGEGPARKSLESQIKKYQLEDKILLTGKVPQAHRYLKAFDLLVLPSVKEGLPYIILKAVAIAVPLVATRVGGLPEVVDHNFLVEPKNPQALAAKIEEVLNSQDIKQQHQPPKFDEFLAKTISLYK
ncbi:MAG: hypothetical protein A2666_03160 [Parcubacteria group bacterium RIFCSPHIGHO2_01_FULL_47_10b]|nr:MAG: hypothetical protein A2666_03160 [Parcubacteria group bacterium RIFCSPHIGHO2_01_FULL_47_10b]